MYLQIFIVLLTITTAYPECSKETANMLEISCTSLLDLQNVNVDFANVTILPDWRRIDVRMQTINKPTLQLTLTDEGNTISESKLTQLNEIPKSIFGGSRIDTIRSNLFSNSPFKTIHWSNGEISSIEIGAFSNSNNLTEISITNHKLTTVTHGIFSGLNLQMLALSGNRIRLIERDAFKDMVYLQSLYLDHNDLLEFQAEVLFNHGESIQNLWLNGNSITDFDRNLVRGLTNLRVLNLAHNKISRILRYTFEYLPKLERLSLAHNLLVDFDGSIFPDNGLPNLRTLHISNNLLSYLTSTTLEKLNGLTEISIVGNPWQCPCYEILLDWLAHHDIEQVCHQEYSDGTRPVCVVVQEHRTTCSYSVPSMADHAYLENNLLEYSGFSKMYKVVTPF